MGGSVGPRGNNHGYKSGNMVIVLLFLLFSLFSLGIRDTFSSRNGLRKGVRSSRSVPIDQRGELHNLSRAKTSENVNLGELL